MNYLVCIVVLIAVASARDASECEQSRQAALDKHIKGVFVVKCEPDGTYSPLQCHERYCHCRTPEGEKVNEATLALRDCACPLLRKDAIYRETVLNFDGVFTPQCGSDGYYESRQCHPSTGYCFCTDKLGNQLGEQSRDINELNC